MLSGHPQNTQQVCPHLDVAKYLPLGENWRCRTSAPCGNSSCAKLSALSSSITLDTLAALNAQSPGSGIVLADVSGPEDVGTCHHESRRGKPGRKGVARLPVVRCNLITARTAFWKRTRGSRTSRWISCLCLWVSAEPGPSLEMDGIRAVPLISTSSAVSVTPFLALTLSRRVAANHARKWASDARVAAKHLLHHCIASRYARTIPSSASLSRVSEMTCSSHFWSFCVRNVHRSNTNQPEMEIRPDDATSWWEQKAKGGVRPLRALQQGGQTYRHDHNDRRRDGILEANTLIYEVKTRTYTRGHTCPEEYVKSTTPAEKHAIATTRNTSGDPFIHTSNHRGTRCKGERLSNGSLNGRCDAESKKPRPYSLVGLFPSKTKKAIDTSRDTEYQ